MGQQTSVRWLQLGSLITFKSTTAGCLTDSACVTWCRLKGKGLKLLHHYPDQLWGMGDKSVPNAGFTPARIFPQVSHLRLYLSGISPHRIDCLA